MGRPRGLEQSELTKMKIKVANLRSAFEVARLKLEDAEASLREMLTLLSLEAEDTTEIEKAVRRGPETGVVFEPGDAADAVRVGGDTW